MDNGAPLPPRVIDRQPANGQELPADGKLRLTFDQDMDSAATTNALKVADTGGGSVQGQVSWPTPRTLLFSPAQPLKAGTKYLASLTTQARSAKGVQLTDPLAIQFASVGELQVSQVFPANNTGGVAANAVITAIFNRPVAPLVTAEQKKELPSPLSIDPPVAGKGEWVNTSVYAFRPEKGLKGGVTYTVQIKAGLADASGESTLAQDYEWKFATDAPSINALQLASGETNPASGYQNVLLDTAFTIVFNQAMDPASTEAALSISGPGAGTVSLKTLWNLSDTSVIITPTERLALGSQYTLALKADAQAQEGGPLREGLNWNFSTVPAPGVKEISPANGTTQQNFDGTLNITFLSPMNFASVKDKIVIKPAPQGTVNWWYNDYAWSVQAYVLQPSTSYEVHLLPGMKDIYGNQTSRERVFSFTTGAYQPQANLQMPYEPALLRVGGPQSFYAAYVNVDWVRFQLFKVKPEDFSSFMYKGSLYQYNPPLTNLVWSFKQTASGNLNERALKSFTPTNSDGSPLSPGLYFLGMDAPGVKGNGPFADARLMFVSSTNLAFKSTGTEGVAWLTDLASGQPVPGVAVTIYDKNFQAVGSATSDANGLASMSLPPQEQPYDPRFAMTQAGDRFAFASSQWGSGVNTYDYGIWSGFYGPTQQGVAYIYSDRPIYRPGQPVYFKGIARLDDDLAYSLPKETQVNLTLENFQGKVSDMTLPLSSFGSFDGKLALDSQAALGYYTLYVRFPGSDTVIGSVLFNVAEYRKPEFSVDVSAGPADVLAGDHFTATVKASYYSGGGAANANVGWTLTSNPFSFNPDKPGLARYQFTDYEADAGMTQQNTPPLSKVIAQGTGKTDANGQFSLDLPAELSEYKTSRQLVLEATVIDLSGNAVSGRASVIAHRSRVYVGARPKVYVGIAGQEQTFESVAVDWQGNPVAGQKINVDIVERRWYSVQEQDATGRVQWTSSVQEIPVTSFKDLAVDSQGQASVKFTPANGGVFAAKVSALDAGGNQANTAAYMWVAGTDFVPWRQTNDRGFQLIADRDSYQPGDTAEVLIASPFKGDAYALVTVERGHVRSKEVLHLTGNSTLYKLPITADMAPNVYVSALVVKGVDDNNTRPDFKMGLVELKVDTLKQAVTVQITPDKKQAGPGDQVTYTVTTKDSDGKPVSAELSLGLTDLATLSLADPNSLPILNYFYQRRGLGVWTSMPILLSIEEYNATIQPEKPGSPGMGAGGGKGGGDLGVIEVRENFPDTAYWEAHLTTGDGGQTTATVTLPDNLTTWRLDARAVTLDTRVGQATLDIISSKPLLVRPQTPRFFVAGDQSQLGAAVHNNTDQDLSVDVSMQSEGLTLQSPATQKVQIPAHQQTLVTWDTLTAMDAQRVDLVFSAQGGGFSDASRPTAGTLDTGGVKGGLPVYRYEAPETVGASGQLTEAGSKVEAISLPTTYTVTQGSLDITLAPSLAAGMTDGLAYLEQYPYECVEQTVSRFLPNVISTRALKAANRSDPALEKNLADQVATGLQRLYNWQSVDGGWGWWPIPAAGTNDQGQPVPAKKSDVQTTAYVVLALVEAKDAGYPVSEGVVQRGTSFLQANVVSLAGLSDPSVVNQQAFVLYVLGRAGLPDVSRSVQLYDQRNNMALYGRAFLAQTLYQIDKGDPRIQTLLSDLNNAAITSATGTHWEEANRDPGSWNTNTRTTAILLSALSQLDPKNPLNANAVRWLMSNRTDGHWVGTQETAWSLMALTNWMVASGELQASYNWGVAFNGQRVGGGVANADTLRQTQTLRVNVADMLQGQVNRLAIARDEGGGSLYYTAHLNVSLPVEQVQPLDQGIVVSRSYFPNPDSTTPVTQAKWGDLVLGRLTVVVPNDVYYIVIADPLPAGLEALDQALNISPQNNAPVNYGWEDLMSKGWGWWYFNHVELRDEKLVLSADYLPAGTYVYTYLARAGTPGTFRVIPPTAQEFYFPEVYGRGAGSLFTVTGP
ncbi:MAG TPA: Ig-like domain-containing protein [Anaerolineales bacterium]